MAPALKVYGIRLSLASGWKSEHSQPRVIVAARSKASALEAYNAAGCNLSRNHFNGYGGQTWNVLEVAVAMSKPGAVFYAKNDYPRSTEDWAEAPER